MRYAENWTKVDIDQLNLENVLAWCTNNLKGKQFIEGNTIKFSDTDDATKFKLEYKQTNGVKLD
jgi:hypothetical protein